MLLDLVSYLLKVLHASVDGGVKLHGVFGGMFQCLLQVGDLSGEFALGC